MVTQEPGQQDHTYTLNPMNRTFSDDDNLCTISHPPDDGCDGADMGSQDTTLKTFTTYCDKPYDRHVYRMYSKDGKYITFDDYELMRYYWYQMRKEVSHVTIVEPKKKRGGQGF